MAYSVIKKPSDYFNTVLYSGDGTSNRSITGVNFQPDLVWIKNRNSTNNHQWVDSVRGLFRLGSDSSLAEASVSGAFNSFDSDGFNVTEEANWEFNNSGKTYASWNWLGANGTVANTDGSISSTVSANTTSGFSIVSWTGTGANATIGHGLGAEPKMIFLKIRTGTNNWQVYNKSIGSGNALFLNTTDASSSNTGWQSTDATSSFFYVSGGGAVNGSGQDMIAYCFAEKQGFSKFGSYVGNGSTDGTFVYTGFKPAFTLIKPTSISGDWRMHDNKRNSFNVLTNTLKPNSSGTDDVTSGGLLDYTSNGFKWRTNNTYSNGSGVSFIYMCFAEEPLVGDNPATAR